MAQVNRCIICGAILDNPRAKYCAKCRREAGRRYPKVIHVRVTREQYEVWKMFRGEERHELAEVIREQLEKYVKLLERARDVDK